MSAETCFPIPSEAITFTKDMVAEMQNLLRLNSNQISAVYWQADEWFPKISPYMKIRWIERIRDNEFKFPEY